MAALCLPLVPMVERMARAAHRRRGGDLADLRSAGNARLAHAARFFVGDAADFPKYASVAVSRAIAVEQGQGFSAVYVPDGARRRGVRAPTERPDSRTRDDLGSRWDGILGAPSSSPEDILIAFEEAQLVPPVVEMRACSGCHIRKSVDAFYTKHEAPATRCKECVRAAQRANYARRGRRS